VSVMSDDEVLVIERRVAAPPERVFALWTEPEQLAKWWGPDGYDVPQYDLDVRKGGAWRTVMRSPDGKALTVSGVYREIDPPRRLVFTWAWDDENGTRGHETEITVTFEPAPGGTHLRLLQQRFHTRLARDNHNRGWISTFDRLERAIAS